jgi:endoglucanase
MQSRCSRLALLASLICLTPTCASAPDDGSWTPPDHEDTVAPAGSPVDVHGQLKVVGTQLLDKNNQPVQLKGVSSMWLNMQTQTSSGSKKALAFMRDDWKLSVIRAAMPGTAAGPVVSMVRKVDNIIRNALALGVYVIVDWHTETAVDQQAAAVAFFTTMAQRYGAYPNVIWEPYNEPKGYDWSQIKAYHQAVVDAIRAEDPDNLIVLGTPQWSQKVDVAAEDPVAGTNLLYTLHFYSCTHFAWLRSLGDIAIKAGLALFITEFGATFSDGGLPPDHDYVCADEATAWFDWMATNNISGVAWKLDVCPDASCILESGASTNGPWSDDDLTTFAGGEEEGQGIKGGHGVFVVNWLRQ